MNRLALPQPGSAACQEADQEDIVWPSGNNSLQRANHGEDSEAGGTPALLHGTGNRPMRLAEPGFSLPRISTGRFFWQMAEAMSMLLALTLSVVPSGEVFTCTPVAVWDGDGPIWCAEGPRVRLAGIAARELDGSCRPGHPCPTAGAIEARSALVSILGKPVGRSPHGHVLVEGPALHCTSEGPAGGRRTAAWCTSPIAGDVSCAMVTGGWALRWKRYWKDHHC
jgi:endonuclease YncB( thermonuclease family)